MIPLPWYKVMGYAVLGEYFWCASEGYCNDSKVLRLKVCSHLVAYIQQMELMKLKLIYQLSLPAVLALVNIHQSICAKVSINQSILIKPWRMHQQLLSCMVLFDFLRFCLPTLIPFPALHVNVLSCSGLAWSCCWL